MCNVDEFEKFPRLVLENHQNIEKINKLIFESVDDGMILQIIGHDII